MKKSLILFAGAISSGLLTFANSALDLSEMAGKVGILPTIIEQEVAIFNAELVEERLPEFISGMRKGGYIESENVNIEMLVKQIRSKSIMPSIFSLNLNLSSFPRHGLPASFSLYYPKDDLFRSIGIQEEFLLAPNIKGVNSGGVSIDFSELTKTHLFETYVVCGTYQLSAKFSSPYYKSVLIVRTTTPNMEARSQAEVLNKRGVGSALGEKIETNIPYNFTPIGAELTYIENGWSILPSSCSKGEVLKEIEQYDLNY